MTTPSSTSSPHLRRLSNSRIGENSSLQFTVVIPCYNESHAIEETIGRLREALSKEAQYTIVVVNDGSTDDTKKVLDLLAPGQDLQIVHHSRNLGYGAALKTGIRAASTELIAITDADGTYPNERIYELVTLCANRDMVIGARVGENVQHQMLRSIPKYFLRRWMSWIARRDIPDINSGMRVFKKSIVEKFFGILPDGFSFTVTITLAMMTNYYSVYFVPISYGARIGKSKISPIKDTLRFVALVLRTGVYFAPMRVFGPIVAIFALLTCARLFYDIFIIRDITDTSVLLLFFTFNTGMLTLLADMIDKRMSG